VKLRPLNGSQRGVLVIALGFALYFFGQWLLAAWEYGSRGNFGWVAYAPLSNSFNPLHAWHPWVVLLYWLVLLALWTMASLVILQRRQSQAPS
jgi:heme/copper-type cytochrome/quinol oxidase subunit 1